MGELIIKFALFIFIHNSTKCVRFSHFAKKYHIIKCITNSTVSCRLIQGEYFLKKCIMAMPSYTYVIKGEKLLKARGYSCEIRRNEITSKEGCGYSLYVFSNCLNASEILNKYSVPYTIKEYGGV